MTGILVSSNKFILFFYKKGGDKLSNLSKKVEELYAEFERHRTIAKENSDAANEIKNEIMSLMEESGRDTVVYQGLEAEDMIAILANRERDVLNKKMVCERIGIKASELKNINDWVKFVSDGIITPEIVEESTEKEERAQLSFKKYTGEDDDAG